MARVVPHVAVVALAALAACCTGCGKLKPVVNATEQGIKLLEEGRYEQAAQFLESAATADPTNSALHAYLGTACLRAGNLDKAGNAFRKAIELAPDNPVFHEFLGRILMEQNRFPAALSALNDSLELDPDNARVLTAIASVKLGQDNTASAEDYLKRALKANEAYLPAIYNIAFLYSRRLNSDAKAQPFFERYLELAEDPVRSLSARTALAQIAKRREQIAAGKADRRQDRPPADRQTPPASNEQPAMTREQRRELAVKKTREGLYHYGMSDWKRAARSLEQAVELDPTYDVAHYNLGLAHLANADYENAATSFEEALQLDPDKKDARYALASTMLRMNQNSKAIRILELLLNGSPDYAPGHYLLGHIYSRNEGTARFARKHYAKYLELAPQGPYADEVRKWLAPQTTVRRKPTS